ncbi:sugar ABC transporter permease [Ruminococcus sp.]|jgi:multiple sugar transport system permease protein|uniref:carbohydrate ABC transporter permease n=1 Tax=Ruminococcus sp. TaxID=41978 RepID=UPI001B1BE70D|nr:sugar ABC transporter permease [Ruminococcus sp.]MBE6874055.1 sugar ABC transporter permease [Ruminococcus albus]MBO5557460.1 sugar ABC transporter permease [Ruminococcus sp.]
MKHKSISYAKWGYIFIIPFFVAFILFNLIPLVSTFYNSLFENYLGRGGLVQVGPNFIGLDNFRTMFAPETELGKYFGNTFILWILGFIPQIFFSLLFASWFTDLRMKLKTGAYKVIFYLPNVIMAAAMGMLFYTMFAQNGPINSIYMSITGKDSPYMFFDNVWSQRSVIAIINFLMWYGNTTIMLMAAINGVDPSLYESAQIDGATPSQTFWKITLPLIRPILLYVLITSLIGGLQMYDVPQIITKNGEQVQRTSMTVVMYLQKHLYSKNYGMAGALSVILFVVAAVLSLVVFYVTTEREPKKKVKKGGIK